VTAVRASEAVPLETVTGGDQIGDSHRRRSHWRQSPEAIGGQEVFGIVWEHAVGSGRRSPATDGFGGPAVAILE